MKKLQRIPVVALLVLVACGGQDAETDAAMQPDTGAAQTSASGAGPVASGPCSYITEADVSQIMGQPMKFGEAAEQEECLLVATSGDATISVSFRVQPTTAVYDQMATGDGVEPLSGIGDRAIVHQMGASSMVAAVKGSRGYLGGVYNASQQSAAKQQAVDVAKRVVARM